MAWTIFSLEKQDGVAIATMTRDPGNSYNSDLMHELAEAGADINMLASSDPHTKSVFFLQCNETLQGLERTPKVIIAAINGHCVGGGLEIALACDMRMMGRTVGKIGLPEVKLGVLPGTGGSQRLPRLIGKGRALEMMVTGDLIDADEAKSIGLVNRVVDGDVLEETVAFARTLATGATMAQGLIKLAVQEGMEMTLNSGLALERELQNRLFSSADGQEGIKAYAARRDPDFQGR